MCIRDRIRVIRQRRRKKNKPIENTPCWMMQLLFMFYFMRVPPVSYTHLVCYDYHYTHILYNWECGNVDNERQRNYLYTLATDKLYTQELRVYNIGESIKIRYKYLWNTYFENKESIIKKHMWKNIILLFPIEICKLSIIIYIIYGILNGKYTLGDFSLYLGVMGQMVNSIYVMKIGRAHV